MVPPSLDICGPPPSSLALTTAHTGLEVDGDSDNEVLIYKQVGKVAALRKLLQESKIQLDKTSLNTTGMAHTRWATHGQPSPINCHPHTSDARNEFTVVHNGIITNYKELRLVLEKRGYRFNTDTDTEVAAVLAKYLWDSQKGKQISFTSLIKSVIKELVGLLAYSPACYSPRRPVASACCLVDAPCRVLTFRDLLTLPTTTRDRTAWVSREPPCHFPRSPVFHHDLQEGAFAFVFKSIHFPDEIVVCRRGSPVLIGVKTDKKLKVDFVDVEFGTAGDDKEAAREWQRGRWGASR